MFKKFINMNQDQLNQWEKNNQKNFTLLNLIAQHILLRTFNYSKKMNKIMKF